MKNNVFKVIAIVLLLAIIIAGAVELNELKYEYALKHYCDTKNYQLVEYGGHRTVTGWTEDHDEEIEVIDYIVIDNATGHTYYGSVNYEYALSK